MDGLRELRERRGFLFLDGVLDDLTSDRVIAICDSHVFGKHPTARGWWVSALSVTDDEVVVTCRVELPPESTCNPYILRVSPDGIPGRRGYKLITGQGVAWYMVPVAHSEEHRVIIERCDLLPMESGTASSSSASCSDDPNPQPT